MLSKDKAAILGALAVAAISVGGVAIASGSGEGDPSRDQGIAQVAENESAEDEGANDDDATEQPITGDPLAKASEVALQHTGGGTVTGTEVGDEESHYEVEVTMEDGRQIDVQLDEQFNVVGSEGDGQGEDD